MANTHTITIFNGNQCSTCGSRLVLNFGQFSYDTTFVCPKCKQTIDIRDISIDKDDVHPAHSVANKYYLCISDVPGYWINNDREKFEELNSQAGIDKIDYVVLDDFDVHNDRIDDQQYYNIFVYWSTAMPDQKRFHNYLSYLVKWLEDSKFNVKF